MRKLKNPISICNQSSTEKRKLYKQKKQRCRILDIKS